MREEMKYPPITLSSEMRGVVEAAVKDLCDRRGYILEAVHARTNHVHTVISAQRKPERIVSELKANATKMLREASLVGNQDKVWSRGRSRRYLWKPRHVIAAIDYVLYSQGDVQV